MYEWNLYQSYLDLGGKRDAMFEWRYSEYQDRNFKDEMSRQEYEQVVKEHFEQQIKGTKDYVEKIQT